MAFGFGLSDQQVPQEKNGRIRFDAMVGLGARENGEGVGLCHQRAVNQKLQNVMAVTDFLALFWQFQHNQKRVTP